MSTDLKTITGRIERPINNMFEVDYKPCELHINSFWGGEKKGLMIQLTLSETEPYIQLDKSQVDELIDVLQKWRKDESN